MTQFRQPVVGLAPHQAGGEVTALSHDQGNVKPEDTVADVRLAEFLIGATRRYLCYPQLDEAKPKQP